MASLNFQLPLAVEAQHGWHQLPCLPFNERTRKGFSAPRGHLSDNPSVERVLQGLLIFGPSCFLLLAAPLRVFQLYRAKLVTLPNYRGALKAAVTLTLFALNLAETVYIVREMPHGWRLFAQLLSSIASATVCILSFLEHGRSVSPSAVLTVYLTLAIFSGGVRFGLLYVARNLCGSSVLPPAIFAFSFILLVLEGQIKTSILREPYRSLAPEETAGFFGNAFFWWVNKIIALGHAKIMSMDDMPPLASYLDNMKIREDMQRTWDKRSKPEHRYTLVVTLFRSLWRPNLDCVPPRILYTVLRYCQPVLISRAIAYVGSDLPPLENRNEAFRLILLTFVIYTGIAMFNGMYDIRINRLTVMTRMAMVGVIHNRCLTIKDGVFDDSAAVSLMANDAEQVTYSANLFHDFWAQVVDLCIGMYLLALELGWVCVLPLLIVAFSSLGSKFVTSNVAARQKALSMAIQTRISMTKAILDSIKNVKMMGLVDKMEAKIVAAREHELKMWISFNWLVVAFNAGAAIVNVFSPAITLIIYAIQAKLRGADAIDVNLAFTSLAIIGMVSGPANTLLSILPNVAALIASFDRIQKYLVSPDREDKREVVDKKYSDAPGSLRENGNSLIQPIDSSSIPETLDRNLDSDADVAVSVDDATIRPASTADPVLKNISTGMRKGSLIICSGAVGTGKTVLAKAILGDLPPDTGTITTAFGTIAYCAQTAWIINGTIEDIIRGPPCDHAEIDEAWYQRVLHACDLNEDLDHLPDGDKTVVGSRGITLSGGQKQRVALARAVYAHKNMIILDDVLSALDPTTERHIVKYLIGPKGLFRELGTTVLLITHSTQHLPLADHIVILGEDGKIVEQGSWDELRSDAGYISRVVLKEKDEHSEELLDDPKLRDRIQAPTAKKTDGNLEDLARKTGDITLYAYYFGAIGSLKLWGLFLTMTVYASFLGLMPYWLRLWAESGGQNMLFYTSIYFLLTLGVFISTTMSIANIFLVIAPTSGRTLHARLLHTVMRAPQSYFSTTDTGTTLNRFSADSQTMDRRLPVSLMQAGHTLFRLLSQCILLGVVQPLVTATLPFTFIAVYIIQKFYLTTSRQLRFLDLETRALVNASFLETLEGVATIRAFGWQRPFVKDNVKKLDLSVRPSYLMMCIQRWLNVVLDLTVLGLAMLVVSLAVGLKGTTTGGQIGIAMNVVLQANMLLLRLVEAWTSMETSLGAISRLRSFQKDVQPEDKPDEVHQPPQTWPARGSIDFDHTSAAYNPGTLALNGVTVSIEPGKRVGVCGRTGSGKSSLLLSLLRLIEIESGGIKIDDLDLTTLPRNSIRSRLITIPQDPMLVMTDTVRQNLDIADSSASDEDIIRVLERVRLWTVFQSRASSTELAGREARELEAAMGGRGASSSSSSTPKPVVPANDVDAKPPAAPVDGTTTLDAVMKSLPLSHGQQQLFSLARAILMRPTRGKVVLLDEATANVDNETNDYMQKLIREEFKDHTIITVAHRLETIMDSDVLLVLEAGKLIEVGSPSELAAREGGKFRALYHGKR